MNPRTLEFIVGIETSPQPDPGTPSQPGDIVSLQYLEANYGKAKRVTGSPTSPYLCVAGTSIAHGLLAAEGECVMFLQGQPATTTDMSANPQIAVGTKDGQRLTLIFCSDSARVKLEDGTGLYMKNGDLVSKDGTVSEFIWSSDQSRWEQAFWNNVGDMG